MTSRRRIDVVGTVQGVGFRPWVFNLASRLGLRGFVRNEVGTVHIEVEGEAGALERFETELVTGAPPLARIESVRSSEIESGGESGFAIETSDRSTGSTVFVSPDVATCDACLFELRDPSDRRFRHAFANCTHCGPRLTIIDGSPYDRERTSMARFSMCPACRSEYDDPRDRRFHAQPIACPRCGPQLTLSPDETGEPLQKAVARLSAGHIVAVKGIGGYHIACDATNGSAVAELRRRKHRHERPLAVLVPDLEEAAKLAVLGDDERALLSSAARPIVLARRRLPSAVSEEVCCGSPWLGVMLPYTPLHHLLADEIGKPLVLTSGNRSDEPIAYEDDDATERLSSIADAFLTHDRPIRTRCDDSVVRIVAGAPLPIRRSRGYAPEPMTLAAPLSMPTLALGAQLKAVFALGEGRRAILGHHIGDLDEWSALRSYREGIAHYEALFGITPALLAHDMHPDYASTRYALERAERDGVKLLPVQHHHAHLASCLAEHGATGVAIGVIFDGAGYGTDGTIWGGEILVGDASGFERFAHLRHVPMPGGERAIVEPWRMAVAHLVEAEHSLDVVRRDPDRPVEQVADLARRGVASPRTSAMGRLFDAIASIAGVRDTASYEGQAAIELEWLLHDGATVDDTGYELHFDSRAPGPIEIDPRPLVRQAARDSQSGAQPRRISQRFHSAVSAMVGQICETARTRTGIDIVALSGGVFQNAWLSEAVVTDLQQREFTVLRHRRVPPNDGGLCLGQLAVAAAVDSSTASG